MAEAEDMVQESFRPLKPVSYDPTILESWMAHLDPSLREHCPLIRLAIPGSHDSMMYKMQKKSPITPEAPEFVAWLLRVYPNSVRDWVVTQGGDVTEQLKNGIRYFDVRVCRQGDEFMLCHGVFSGESLGPLREIRQFLDTHPSEVVIVDFQHVYRCESCDHKRYCQELIQIFGEKIYTRSGNDLKTCTLAEMQEKGKQVILIYRDYADDDEVFWMGSDFRTPWPNTTKVKELVEKLKNGVARRPQNAGYVAQCVLTPVPKFIMQNLLSNLKKSCAIPVLKSMTGWIKSRPSGPDAWPGYNIFIADFVCLNDYQFVKAVLSLNGICIPSNEQGDSPFRERSLVCCGSSS